jgi:4-hydroxy-tetrahydrodipicolinate synthase
VRTLLWEGNQEGAEKQWRKVGALTKLLFTEPSPSPAKHWLWRTALIDSPEVRLPMVEVSTELAATLDLEIERRTPPLRRRA